MPRALCLGLVALLGVHCKQDPASATAAAPATVSAFTARAAMAASGADASSAADAGSDEPAPVLHAPPPHVVSLAMGEGHACVVLADRTARCWGLNNTGQLGDGTSADHRFALPVTDLTDVAQLALGQAHSCAVLVDHSVRCWGQNTNGQLGEGTSSEHDLPHAVTGVNRAESIAAGMRHTCVILHGGSVQCWGQNAHGELGDGSRTDRSLPTSVRGLAGVAQLALGDGVSCARLRTGSVRCWGDNGDGTLLGAHAGAIVVHPTALAGAARVVDLVASGRTVCGRMATGSVRCWGAQAAELTEQAIGAIAHAEQVALGAGTLAALGATPEYHAFLCVRCHDGTTACAGDNAHGQLGNGTQHAAPGLVEVQGLRNAAQLVAGGESLTTHAGHGGSACALLSDATVRCWGSNDLGELGEGTLNDRATPTPIEWP